MTLLAHPCPLVSYHFLFTQANAIGVKKNELHFLYELHPCFSAFPTFPINLAFKRTNQDVFDFLGDLGKTRIPGCPPLDPQRSVDGERGIEVVTPIPGGNLVVEHLAELVDAKTDKVYTRMSNAGVAMKQGGLGGPSGPKKVAVKVPTHEPDAISTFHTTEEVAMLYRLCGDYNPLHADDEFGKPAGFEGHILQGLGTWNIVAHEVLRLEGGSDPSRFMTYGARFRNVVYPGDVLETKIWKVKTEEALDHLVFETIAKSDGRLCLSNGYATIKSLPLEMAKL
ncbi:Thioesterase/thiol ester dehydrase-isomerase [Aureobasidium melanogenum CBS 110374]|uniref:Thioesterase/thiol ester dehydrase-isomerase n=1 Tax=Aureobasidium melanogenum (strain CBS 110374) TaxID=1043003 RepID=A0A074VI14_AURM1|nr:Thioesterase/thiol ester dehydrase-isomerase [Aureobasidium melanogenum CBS 110374]KEQ58684.1 Thioesterase/thiol ester dehydrase-isomerase [Aureobasidium melanogenum CBS 110374]